MLRKPRFGRRRCSGIWPPSKPLMRTPERAVWPLPPRPPVLPLPEPMPRPMRLRALREPALSASSIELHRVSYLLAAGLSATRRRRARDARPWRSCRGSTACPSARATRPILLSPSPISVSRWCASRRIGLPICSTLTVLLASCALPAQSLSPPLSRPLFGLAALAAARLQRRNLDVAARRDRARRILMLQRVERRAHHVVGIRRAERLRHHVLHAERLEHGAHRTAGDDAGAGRRRAQDAPCRRRDGRARRDAACGLRAAARGSSSRLAASVALRIASGTSRALP